MSFGLEKHQQNVATRFIYIYHAEIAEIEGHFRLRAMANVVRN
jgi:hypothetical protein